MAKAASGSCRRDHEGRQSLFLWRELCGVSYFEEPPCVMVHSVYIFERNWYLLSIPAAIFLSITDTFMTTRPHHAAEP